MEFPLYLQFSSIFVLLLFSAYFSSSETALMKLNPYRLRHLVSEGHRGARKANKLLRQQDRLLSVILIGNNLVNFCAATIAANACGRLLGVYGDVVSVIGLTLIVLIFAEVAPKTIAAERPEKIAFPSSYLLEPLQRIFRPVVFVVNYCSGLVVAPFIKRVKAESSSLSVAELRTVVNQESDIDLRRQAMLLGILDLGNARVKDIMIPYSEVDGIDLAQSESTIVDNILRAQHTRLPVYRDELNNVVGTFHLKYSGQVLAEGKIDLIRFERNLEKPYFIPHSTKLSTQLLNFQQSRKRVALVVDEYGVVMGFLTLEDILEEIVGEYTTDYSPASNLELLKQEDGSYLVNGRTLLRELNAALKWDLPTDGPRTLNGLILEQLEGIPDGNTSLRISTNESIFTLETVQVRLNKIRSILVRRTELRQSVDDHEEADN